MNSLFIFLFYIISMHFINANWTPCIQERINYRLRCREEEEITKFGHPSAFARTGYYDRLFKKMNMIGYDEGYWRYPTLGYNPNIPADRPFRVFRYGNY